MMFTFAFFFSFIQPAARSFVDVGARDRKVKSLRHKGAAKENASAPLSSRYYLSLARSRKRLLAILSVTILFFRS